MKNTLFLIIIGISCTLTSCKIKCTDFDRNILSWIPYQENDVIELYSQSKDSTILFSIKSIDVTHTTSYKLGSKCGGCSDEIFINDWDSDFRFTMNLNDNKVNSQDYKIFNTYFSDFSEHKNYKFEGKKYETVRIFENNDTKVSFKKLIIAKDYGVIGLIDNFGNTWVLKTVVKIKRINDNQQQKSITINNVSC